MATTATTPRPPTVTIGRAAHAAGIDPRVLRTALDRGTLQLLDQMARTGPQWRRFAAVDVVRFAVLRRLLDLGIPVTAAASILTGILDRCLGGLGRDGTGVTPYLITGRLQSMAAHIAPLPGGEWHAALAPKDTLARMRETTITLNLGAIAADALARLSA